MRKFPRSDLWITINSNFLDVAVLEWCKLFADNRARNGWRWAVIDPDAFLAQLLHDLESNQSTWASYLKGMRSYRDKFIPHLDDDEIMHAPVMDLAEAAVLYLFNTIRLESPAGTLQDLPTNLREYGKACSISASNLYAKALSVG